MLLIKQKLNKLKNEVLQYNKQDCLVLYQVIESFYNQIFNLFKLNLVNFPTLSTLSFSIFRSYYLEENVILISNKQDYDFISQSYKGGHVDVYRPFNKKGNKIYCYDYNSLYPTVMAKYPMPIGILRYFFGKRDLNNIFGFIKVNVTCPFMYCPVLLNKNNNKSIAPIGQ